MGTGGFYTSRPDYHSGWMDNQGIRYERAGDRSSRKRLARAARRKGMAPQKPHIPGAKPGDWWTG